MTRIRKPTPEFTPRSTRLIRPDAASGLSQTEVTKVGHEREHCALPGSIVDTMYPSEHEHDRR